ncbi:MAG TPA: hypothetical protein VLA17_07795 [Candidatus Limnocylindria bacterium]|nr:hypothetical protein [Candidatus Limnocylindria bacterium]
MTPDEIRERFGSLTVWKRGGERAPHKPLLALYAIGRGLRGEPRMASYAQFDKDLAKLLVEFGPPRQDRYRQFYPEDLRIGFRQRRQYASMQDLTLWPVLA